LTGEQGLHTIFTGQREKEIKRGRERVKERKKEGRERKSERREREKE